jgi:hypothetical protein
VVKTEQVEYNASANAPEMSREGYVFIGWSSDEYMSVKGDTEVTAQYVAESEYARVSINRKKLSIMEGCEFKLKATITPTELADTALEWTSDDNTIATVYNGTVTGVAPGTCTITATVVNTGETATCVVTISSDLSKTITLNKNSYLDIDGSGYLRRIAENSNSVEQIKQQFANEGLRFADIEGTELTDTSLVGTGTAIRLYKDDECVDEMFAVMTGDFDGNGRIQTRDVTMMSQHVLQLRDASDIQGIAVDANGDGVVNVRDCAMISRYLVGKEDL